MAHILILGGGAAGLAAALAAAQTDPTARVTVLERNPKVGKKLLRKIHEVFKGGIGPVEFAHGEFRIMARVYAFVAEVAVQLKDFFKSAHQ